MNGARARHLIVQAVPLLAILVLGLGLRLTFYQGVIHTDDLVYSHLAQRLAEGVSPFTQPLPPAFAVVRIGLYAPVALAYWLFGTSDATTLAWPFACSIFGIVGAYGIGRLVHTEASGLLAAFLMAVLPTNVAAGSALLGDGPIAALSIATIFFLLLSSRAQGWKSAAAMAASLVCFGIGILNKPLMLLLLPFLALYAVGYAKRSRLTIAGFLLAIAGAIVGYVLYFGPGAPSAVPGPGTMKRIAMTATDVWSQLVAGQGEFAWIAPLWIVASVALLAWRRAEAMVVLAWVGLTFLYGELGTRTLTTYTPIVWYDESTAARHFLFIAAPAMVLTGIYLAQGLQAAAARWLVALAAIVTGAVAWAGTRGAANMTWGITGEAAADLPFATISGVATILVVFGGIASPALITAQSAVVRGMTTAALVVAIGLASLNHSYRAANEFKGPWIETLSEAVRFLDSQPPLPIVVQDEMFGLRLDYMSGYRLGFQTNLRPWVQNPRIELAPADAATLTDAYILADEYSLKVARDLVPITKAPPPPAYLSDPPARWIQVAEFGEYRANHLKIYRVSGSHSAAELAAAEAAVASNRTPSTLRALVAAAAGAGEYCKATRAWFDLRAMAPAEVGSFNAVPILTECYKANPGMAGPNIFVNGDFSQGLTAWGKHPASEATLQVERHSDGVPVWHADYRRGNWSTIYQEKVLQPDTPYIYEVTIRSTVPVIALYWQVDIGRHFEHSSYSFWKTLQYVFVTPHWEGQPRSAGFNPVLMTGAGEVWLKGLRLSELKTPTP